MTTSPRRLLSWNILHGGGPSRTPEIGLAVLDSAPDLVVLSEFRAARGSQLRAQLADAGLTHQHAAPAPPARNTILIASRTPIVPGVPGDAPRLPGRLCVVGLPEWGLHLCGVHVPDSTDPTNQAACLQFLLRLARAHLSTPCVIVGDFNLGRWPRDVATPSPCEPLLGAISSLGFFDAWRTLHPDAREVTWEGPWGGPGRLDTAYLSPPMRDALIDARYLHGLREAELSDHSALVVDWKPHDPTPPPGTPSPRRGGLFPPPGNL
jgi:exonuclease III